MDNTTKNIIDGLDHAVRPQDDLFRFVNGTWLASAEIPADQSQTGGFMDLRLEAEANVREIIQDAVAHAEAGEAGDEERKVAVLYDSFMDEGRINGLGASPLADDFALIDSAATKEELELAAGRLYQVGVPMPFGLEVSADRNNPSEYICWLYQSGLSLPDEAFYREEQYEQFREQFRAFIPTLYALGTGANDAEAKAAAEVIYGVEARLASHHMSAVDSRDTDKTNNVLTWDELLEAAPGFGWTTAFSGLGLTREAAPTLLVMMPDALAGFAREWAAADMEQLKTYLRWNVVRARAPYLSQDIAQANFNFFGKVLHGAEEMRDRWKRAVALIDGTLGEAVGKLYVERHFPPHHKALMEQLVDDLLAAYHYSISTLDWMTEETRERALAKLATTVTKIGYPDKWRDYSALEITDSLVGNVRAAEKFDSDWQLGKLGTPVDRDEWFMNPQTVNAYYNPVANEIVFPAAILQPPFFDAEADAAYNYGGIGAVIGHEIGHAFDDQGSKYDGEGRLQNWWTDEDRAEFEKRTASLVGQYDVYVPAQLVGTPHHVSGALTLGENIGDLGGLSIALKAYDIAMKREGHASSAHAPVIEGFTGRQRVFLNWARIWKNKRRDEIAINYLAIDPHSPSEFRCNGVVKNVDAFAEEFGVVEGDELYLAPEERVRIW
ncbi:peptidase M13 [Trueperella sp. HMSC08B05]|uniref:Neutral endopeptidase n=1 Tax=Trueperella bernardiae TaxID=59561 RepID=A0A0W1KI95_9ACTO|nr:MULTISPECIES: M13-type metalloendopeptidase [Trueperella]KTF03459.1 Neutral endopeptidase [Trueperella bernardiae]MDV6239199.1 M13-type metalloendopeptidase [Trueperella bernardiae]OFS67550.1 peptidase M13 [Trueperella sp. HMSC08H06]OFS73817.1 peptidase M13 [Trueperella sp. HMSC08B05]PKZ88446.1 peptidase M13 [Trueperella bernardiae]